MDTTDPTAAQHPLLAGVSTLHSALDESEGLDPDFLTADAKAEYLRQLLRASHRVQARIIRVLAGADDVAERAGARSAAHWLAHTDAHHPGRYVGHERLGRRILDSYPAVGRALDEGRIGVDHARVIVDALDALPEVVPGHDTAESRATLVAKAEAHLVGEAAVFTPRQLKVLGRRLLEAVAPEAADEVERDLLEKEERAALQATQLSLHRLGDGTTRIVGRIPDLDAAILRKAVEAYTSPRQRTEGTAAPASERLSAGQRRGQALCLLLRHLPVDGLPQHGGAPVSIVVTVAEDDLRRSTGAGTLDTGDRLSVTGVRQLACTQGLLPAVLGGEGEVLDLGRTRRLFQPAQRRAHLLHHRTCQEESCDVPAAWTEAHHKRPWAEGGRTDLADLAFLCFLHHHRAHDPRWSVEWSSSGAARFRRRE